MLTQKTVSNKIRGTLLLVILLAATLPYLPTLRFGFVYDDEEQLVGNPCIKNLDVLPRAFTENVWAFSGASTNFYRPLQAVTYTLFYSVWGPSAFPYHALNILLHATAAILVALVARPLLRSARGAFLAAIVFALHPTHVESVAWIASLPELLAACFSLVALWLCLKPSRVARTGAIMATGGALLSKEIGLAVPFLLALYVWGVTAGDRPRRALLPLIAPHFALLPVYLLARHAALGGMAPLRSNALGVGAAVLAVVTRVGEDVVRLVYPFGFTSLSAFRMPAAFTDLRIFIGAAVIVAGALAVRRALRGRPFAMVSLGFFLLPLAPTLYLPVIGQQEAIADRYLYMPSIGFALVAARLLSVPTLGRSPFRIAGQRVTISAVIAAILLTFYAAGVGSLLPPWRSSKSLYDAVLTRSPDAHYLRIRRGLTYQRAGDLDHAREDYEETIRRAPDRTEAWLNAGIVYRNQGRLDDARTAFERSLVLARTEHEPNRIADALVNLGELARLDGRPSLAESLLTEAVKVRPTHAVAHSNLGTLYATQLGQPERALGEFTAAVASDPWNPRACENLASLYASMERWTESARYFRETTRIEPHSVSAWLKLGFVSEKCGRNEDAVSAYGKVLRLDPANTVARDRLFALGAPGGH